MEVKFSLRVKVFIVEELVQKGKYVSFEETMLYLQQADTVAYLVAMNICV